MRSKKKLLWINSLHKLMNYLLLLLFVLNIILYQLTTESYTERDPIHIWLVYFNKKTLMTNVVYYQLQCGVLVDVCNDCRYLTVSSGTKSIEVDVIHIQYPQLSDKQSARNEHLAQSVAPHLWLVEHDHLVPPQQLLCQ